MIFVTLSVELTTKKDKSENLQIPSEIIVAEQQSSWFSIQGEKLKHTQVHEQLQ